MVEVHGASLIAQVGYQRARWRTCPRHFFSRQPGGYKIGHKSACAHCGGEAGLVDIGNYIRGYMAAGGDATDIMPD